MKTNIYCFICASHFSRSVDQEVHETDKHTCVQGAYFVAQRQTRSQIG